ncbi:MAG: heat-inducible transcription repressor HrcA [Candidatus Rokubacteria bacterium]|nr:heat-inducible transcription repressor HrcA [Candidatus Rokubacteria bacterium]
MVAPALDERRREVLRAVIGEYIETAEPVGSRSVAKHSHFGLSPATIRNTMADLEELGYLEQPHPSAGRVPTDKAYRFYVDTFGDRSRLSESETARLRTYFTGSHAGVEQLMAETSVQLSLLSRMTGVLLAPPLKQTRLASINLIALPNDRALTVVITETDWVTARTLTLESRVAPDDLRELGRQLTRRFRGRTFQEILEEVAAPPDPLDPLYARMGTLVTQIFSTLREQSLYVGGAINILEHPEFWDIATMRMILRTFEEKERLIDLLSNLADESGVHVIIGSENPFEEMQECSLVTSAFVYENQVLGMLGVVGPKRMPYARVISLVAETAGLVSQSLSRYRHQLYLPS